MMFKGLEERFCSSKPYFCGFGVVSWGAVRMAGADRNVLMKIETVKKKQPVWDIIRAERKMSGGEAG